MIRCRLAFPAFVTLVVLAHVSLSWGQDRDRSSANAVLPGCKQATVPGDIPNTDLFPAGFCMGLVGGISYAGRPLICVPYGVTYTQLTQVVVRYLDQRPERTHEDFKLLASEALANAWPCKAGQ